MSDDITIQPHSSAYCVELTGGANDSHCGACEEAMEATRTPQSSTPKASKKATPTPAPPSARPAATDSKPSAG